MTTVVSYSHNHIWMYYFPISREYQSQQAASVKFCFFKWFCARPCDSTISQLLIRNTTVSALKCLPSHPSTVNFDKHLRGQSIHVHKDKLSIIFQIRRRFCFRKICPFPTCLMWTARRLFPHWKIVPRMRTKKLIFHSFLIFVSSVTFRKQMNSYLEMLNDTMTVPDDEEVGPSKMDRILALVAKITCVLKKWQRSKRYYTRRSSICTRNFVWVLGRILL